MYINYPENISIQKLKADDPLPINLLLLADEFEEVILRYIYHCEVFVLYIKDIAEPIGVLALLHHNEKVVEIKNIAVAEKYQGIRLGSYMLEKAKQIAKTKDYQTIIVGTADTGLREIAFYEKNNFIKFAIRKNFFNDYYPEPIFENGVQLKDMVMMKMELV